MGLYWPVLAPKSQKTSSLLYSHLFLVRVAFYFLGPQPGSASTGPSRLVGVSPVGVSPVGVASAASLPPRCGTAVARTGVCFVFSARAAFSEPDNSTFYSFCNASCFTHSLCRSKSLQRFCPCCLRFPQQQRPHVRWHANSSLSTWSCSCSIEARGCFIQVEPSFCRPPSTLSDA